MTFSSMRPPSGLSLRICARRAPISPFCPVRKERSRGRSRLATILCRSSASSSRILSRNACQRPCASAASGGRAYQRGRAKAIPSASICLRVTMPTTAPVVSRMGPPLLPGFTAALNCR